MSAFDRRVFVHINWGLLGLTLMLFGVGVLNLYSAGGFRMEAGRAVAPYFQKQLIWGGMGLFGMIVFMLFDYRHLKTLAWPIFAATVGMLVAVLLVAEPIYGARRWLDLGFFNLQPSELAKISVLILGAKLLSRKSQKLDWSELAGVIAVGLIPAGLIVLEPDLGSGLSILLLLGGIILYRGLKSGVFKTLLVVIPGILPLGWFFLHDYQKQRILTFLNPGIDPLGAGYHIIQSQIAIGSGKLWGKGFGAGTQSQLRFLPEKHTDFAVAVFGEEWGFFGMIILLCLFCLFLYQIFLTARDAKDRFGSFLAAGVFFYFFWQILINMGMVLGLMPVVGMPLPFISYGGSATLVNFCLIGLVINVSMRRFMFKMG
jgi:rod shape determining protein RodA